MLRFKKKDFYECKSQIFFIKVHYSWRGDRVGKSSMRHGDDFDWFWGHSAKKEAQEVISWNHRGSWCLCTHFLCTAQWLLCGTAVTNKQKHEVCMN